MLSRERACLLIAMMPSALGFVPLMPRAIIDNSRCTRRDLVVDPSDASSSLMHIWDHSPFELLLSTSYVDVDLSKIHSIAPAPGTFIDLPMHESTGYGDISDQMRDSIEFAKEKGNFLDTTEMIKIDISPGFKTPHGFLPDFNKPVTDIEKYQKGVAVLEMANLGLLVKLPIVAAVTALVDFFFVSRRMDVYKEDVDENESEMVTQSATQIASRAVVLALVAGLTLVIFG